jgi:hypothetical protein
MWFPVSVEDSLPDGLRVGDIIVNVGENTIFFENNNELEEGEYARIIEKGTDFSNTIISTAKGRMDALNFQGGAGIAGIELLEEPLYLPYGVLQLEIDKDFDSAKDLIQITFGSCYLKSDLVNEEEGDVSTALGKMILGQLISQSTLTTARMQFMLEGEPIWVQGVLSTPMTVALDIFEQSGSSEISLPFGLFWATAFDSAISEQLGADSGNFVMQIIGLDLSTDPIIPESKKNEKGLGINFTGEPGCIENNSGMVVTSIKIIKG